METVVYNEIQKEKEKTGKESYERFNKIWWNTMKQLSLQRNFKLILKIHT